VQGFNLLFDRPFLLHCAPPNISVRGDFSLSLVESPASEQKGPPGGVPSGHFRRYGCGSAGTSQQMPKGLPLSGVVAAVASKLNMSEKRQQNPASLVDKLIEQSASIALSFLFSTALIGGSYYLLFQLPAEHAAFEQEILELNKYCSSDRPEKCKIKLQPPSSYLLIQFCKLLLDDIEKGIQQELVSICETRNCNFR